AADVVVAAAGGVAAVPVGGGAVRDELGRLVLEDPGRQVLRPVVVVVATEGGRGERGRPALGPLRPADQRGPAEAGDGGVVGVVGVARLLAVAYSGEPVAVLDVGVRVERVHEG